MFWGLILKPGKKYYNVLEQDFHLTHAALDLSDSSGDVQVMLTTENITYLLCTLNKTIPQAVLDQEFAIGDKISFATKGHGVVHLTGNVLPDGMDDLGDEEEEDDEVEMDEEEDVPATNGKPRSAKQAAKVKVAKKIAAGEVSDESDEDDATFTESMLEDDGLLNGGEEDDDDSDEEGEDEEDGEEGEDDDDDDEEDDDEEDDDDDEDDEDDDEDDEEELEEQPKAKQAKLSNDAKATGGALNGNAAKQAAKETAASGGKQEQQKKGAVRTLQDGLLVEDLKVGTGPEAKPGKKIAVYYEGRLKTNNKVFDSTSKGPGLKFALGRGEVIKGWDLGVAGMKVGGKRRLVIPHKLAYGTKGSPPVIPPCSTLVFEVELKKVF
ncbi:46 kDa FK506-binding nuclear protein [Anopheles maculipalpis]|uniref:46 kDa FK506-binding nuclear protein n=1 Tax=Anopheles maculipalpis TaxID=1496333 RepID=UPI00215984C5|nr:46 kDa FK506-binding nuclear protein [Anopheles maculipalpis]